MKREWSLSLTSEKFVHLSSLFVLALLVSTPPTDSKWIEKKRAKSLPSKISR